MANDDSFETDQAWGTSADEFKPLSELFLPDPRQGMFVGLNPDGTTRNRSLVKLHGRISSVFLSDSVPQDVRVAFDTARNLLLYSWFVYRFQTVADLQAYAALELALKLRCKADGLDMRNLGRLLPHAIEKKWLNAEGVQVFQQSMERRNRYQEEYGVHIDEMIKEQGLVKTDPVKSEEELDAEYLDGLKDGIPLLRNSIAHGNPFLTSTTLRGLEICRDLINQLFPKKDS